VWKAHFSDDKNYIEPLSQQELTDHEILEAQNIRDYDLAGAKSLLMGKIAALMESINYGEFLHLGEWIKCDDRGQLSLVKIDKAINKLSWPFPWPNATGGVLMLPDADALHNLQDSAANHELAAYFAVSALTQQIMGAADVASLEAIDLLAGWPPNRITDI